MADALAPADRSSLAAERGPVNMSVAGVIVLERGPGVTYDALCARVAERIHLIPRYRQRLEQPAMGLANPVWVDDEHFDVGWHVRQTTLPAPGGVAELSAYIGREASRKLDRSRPLWELHLVEGLAGDCVAVIPKMHHALVDGMAAVGVGMILFDMGPVPEPIEDPGQAWQPRPYSASRHFAKLAASPLARAERLAAETAGRMLDASPRQTAADVRRATELVATLARMRPAAPTLSINDTISPNRSYAMMRTPLAPLKDAAKAAGGTVNDAILAVVSGMLSGYLIEAGTDPSSLKRDPVALVPVNIRDGDDDGLGNKISIVFVDLPVREPDPRRRIVLINERMTEIKASQRVTAGALMVDATGFAPPLLSSMLARVPRGDGGRAFNLVVSNVPGPQAPVYMNGSRVLAVHPIVPLNPSDQGLNVGVFSYNGSVCFGLMADAALEPGVDRAAAALKAALDQLVSVSASA